MGGTPGAILGSLPDDELAPFVFLATGAGRIYTTAGLIVD